MSRSKRTATNTNRWIPRVCSRRSEYRSWHHGHESSPEVAAPVRPARRDRPWVLDDDHRARRRESTLWSSTGHAAAVYGDELYDILPQTRGGYGRLQDFGIRFGYERVVLHLEPHVQAGRLQCNTGRTLLLLDHEPLPWARWGDEFAAAMPAEILLLQERAASADAVLPSSRGATSTARSRGRRGGGREPSTTLSRGSVGAPRDRGTRARPRQRRTRMDEGDGLVSGAPRHVLTPREVAYRSGFSYHAILAHARWVRWVRRRARTRIRHIRAPRACARRLPRLRFRGGGHDLLVVGDDLRAGLLGYGDVCWSPDLNWQRLYSTPGSERPGRLA